MDEEALIDKLMLFNSREREGIWKNLYEAEKKRNIPEQAYEGAMNDD